MTLDEYQRRAAATAVYPHAGKNFPAYPLLGLAGEIGETTRALMAFHPDLFQAVVPFGTLPVDELTACRYALEAVVRTGRIAEVAKKAYRDRGGETRLHPEDCLALIRLFRSLGALAAHAEATLISGEAALYEEPGSSADEPFKACRPIVREVGDIAWYLSALQCSLNLDASEVAAANLEKLASRKANGNLNGSGDDRWSLRRAPRAGILRPSTPTDQERGRPPMPTHIRPTQGSDTRMYSPDSDLAWVYGPLIAAAFDGLMADRGARARRDPPRPPRLREGSRRRSRRLPPLPRGGPQDHRPRRRGPPPRRHRP